MKRLYELAGMSVIFFVSLILYVVATGYMQRSIHYDDRTQTLLANPTAAFFAGVAGVFLVCCTVAVTACVFAPQSRRER